MDYNNISLEECFLYYHIGKTACQCDGDTKKVIFSKE